MESKTKTPSFMEMDEERFKRVIAVLIAIVTLLAAVIAYLQSDAGARDDAANRDGMRYSLEAFGRQVSGDARVNYDYNAAYETKYELDLLASSASNREEAQAVERYSALAAESQALSPMLQAPYYDPAGEDGPDVSRYESDVYLVDVTELMENYLAASVVKDAWDYKANTYIVHLTLLAVALFLLGLASTVSSQFTRWMFTFVGIGVAVVTIIWAALLYTQPVFDLRTQGSAIHDYALGVGLAHQDRYEEAVASFDSAVAAYPKYANALRERAWSKYALGDTPGAADDLSAAVAAGDASGSTAAELAYMDYLKGDFTSALAQSDLALKASPDELWIQFDRALILLVSGQDQAAVDAYNAAMQSATDAVAAAKAAGAEPPAYLWDALTDAADSLDAVLAGIVVGEGEPSPEMIADTEMVNSNGEALLARLKSLAVALEYTGQAPQGELTAQVTPFAFAAPVDEEGNYGEPAEVFEYGVDEIGILFDYAGMVDGQEYVFKLYVNGTEDPSWRIIAPWELGESGSAVIPLSYAYSDTFVFEPGDYTVELYVDHQLAQRGFFSISE